MSAPQIQLALDTPDLPSALGPALACGDVVDVVEAGTVLILNEGLASVRALRAAFPDHPVVADIRIARAGAKFAAMAFDAGADRVTVVGECGPSVINDAVKAARDHGGQIEVELAATWTESDVEKYVDAGADHIVAHRFQSGPVVEDRAIRDTLERLAAMDLNGVGITLAGGISASDGDALRSLPFGTVAVGSAIVAAEDPASAATNMQAAVISEPVGVTS